MVAYKTIKTLEDGNIIQIIDGDRGKNYPKNDELLEQGFCVFLNTGNIRDNTFDFENVNYITEAKDHLLRKGKLKRQDIIITTRGTIGSVAFYSNTVPYENIRINSGMVILRVNNDVFNPLFLYYILKSPFLKKQYSLFSSGAAQPQLPIQDFRYIQIPDFDIKTQNNIAKILSHYDELIENNKRRIKILEEMAQKIYKEWFVDFKFPGHENTTFNNIELGKKVMPLKGKNITKATVKKGNIPVVAGGIEPAYYHNVANTFAPVITISASGANAGFTKLYYKDVWASDCSYIDSTMTKYVYYYYLLLLDNKTKINNMQRGAAQPHVYPVDLAKLLIKELDEDIINNFENKVSPLFEQIKILTLKNENLKQTRDILLPRLISGEIDVENLEIE